MELAILEKRFAEIGARAILAERKLGNQWSRRWLSVDVGRDRRGSFFDVGFDAERVTDIRVVDAQPRQRHLLLMAHVLVPMGPGGRGSLIDSKQKFLCGHDERDWFVAAVPERPGAGGVSGVVTAMEALKPPAASASQTRHGVRFADRNRRRNAGFVRQGEWFFIPRPELNLSDCYVHRDEPISRGIRSKPHLVEFLVRTGGQTVYVSRMHPAGLTESQHKAFLEKQPELARRLSWQIRTRGAGVYARGRVRHADHATITLPGWHEVRMNTEAEAPAAAHVVFLD